MPLIIVTGLPTSGKTTRAQQLYDFLSERINSVDSTATSTKQYRLHLISDDKLSISRAVYDLSPSQLPAHTRSANASEKDARAAIYGAVKRVLSDRDIVILDGLNYIKGWRYQLFCEAKAERTPSVVLQVGCSIDRARSNNEARLKQRDGNVKAVDATTDTPQESNAPTSDEALEQQVKELKLGEEEDKSNKEAVIDTTEAYESGNWENLVFRYEEPNGMTRWDSPLFTIIWDDDAAQAQATFASLWEAIAGETRKQVKPNAATLQRARDTGGDYLYLLDRETQDIVKRILEHQQNQDGDGSGGSVAIPRGVGAASAGDDAGLTVHIPPGASVGLAQLQRLRRSYLKLNQGGVGLEGIGSLAVDRIRESFVYHLNDYFDRDE